MSLDFDITRWLFLRALAFIYLMGFLNIVNQYIPLVGSQGLLPIRLFVQRVYFKHFPSLFWNSHSDTLLQFFGWIGVVLSLFALSGFSDQFGFWVYIPVWFALWILYLSFVNLGQTFYWFGWESLLLETGFLAIFFGPQEMTAPFILPWLICWILFRVMFGAGLIKLRGDKCWWDLTCMNYHYETQPMPNPLSWYFHRLPEGFHKSSVLFTHLVELAVPFGFFLPPPICYIAGGLTAAFQLMLILSGNLSWLNYLTIVLCIGCFDDAFFGGSPAGSYPIPALYWTVVGLLILLVVLLSIKPTINLFSSRQAMNASFESLHLVNTYGAFGAITKKRMEIIIEGTDDNPYQEDVEWKEYAFKGKPGDVAKCPPVVAPYHLRLDWLMWFAAMGSAHQYPWIIALIAHLLNGNERIIRLLSLNPFPDKPPKYIRCVHYHYRFTNWKEHSGNWWKRTPVHLYIRPISLEDETVQKFLNR